MINVLYKAVYEYIANNGEVAISQIAAGLDACEKDILEAVLYLQNKKCIMQTIPKPLEGENDHSCYYKKGIHAFDENSCK